MTFGLFVEGANYLAPRDWDALVKLWQHLCEQHGIPSECVVVRGFSKADILKMAESTLKLVGIEGLDVKIARAHASRAFDVLLIAWDAAPPNQDLIEPGCLAEIRFVLRRFLTRAHLPPPFIEDARLLLQHYERAPRPQRGRAHVPRLDAVYMEPMFETLIMCDETLVRNALGVGRERDWPAFKSSLDRPDWLLAKTVSFASDDLRRKIRGDGKTHKHDWALAIARHAAATGNQRFAKHSIMKRLGAVLVPRAMRPG